MSETAPASAPAATSTADTAVTLTLGQPEWWWPVLALVVVGALLLVWGYRRAGRVDATRATALALKLAALMLIAACLLEPLWTATVPRPGANLVVVLADNSRGMTLGERVGGASRGDVLRTLVAPDAPWLARLDETFDVRTYTFAEGLTRSAALASDLDSTGTASNLAAALTDIASRYRDHALAGVVVLSDGAATDAAALSTAGLPPVHTVAIGTDDIGADLALGEVTVVSTSFEDAPVTIHAAVRARGLAGRQAVVRLSDAAGKPLDRQPVAIAGSDHHGKVRFSVRPQHQGVGILHLDIALVDQAGMATPGEATAANNRKAVVVDRGRGPYRILYVAGRPNWDYKSLRRAVEDDDQVDLVALVRIAKREPKFEFGGRPTDNSNPLFTGARKPDGEQSYDQPVLVRLSVHDRNELTDGFPRTAEEVFAYHAVIIDDLEATFFSRDQMELVNRFVAERGGGLLMLGGAESLEAGGYDHTPIGDALPVYTRAGVAGSPPGGARLELTREGLLQPWARLRDQGDAEAARLAGLASFTVINRTGAIKPGASLLATARTASGEQLPALVAQRFGKGRTLALTIGDLWRSGLSMDPVRATDLARFWRQTLRWLIADVPGRVRLTLTPSASTTRATGLRLRVLDAAFAPLDQAEVSIVITRPDGQQVTLAGEPATEAPGEFTAAYLASEPGAYRITATATGADGVALPPAEAGLVVDPDASEFATLIPDRALLTRLSHETGGRVLAPSDLAALADQQLAERAQVQETRTWPLWHNAWLLALIVLLLVGEWALRRRLGMA